MSRRVYLSHLDMPKGDFRYWHETVMPVLSAQVRYEEVNGPSFVAVRGPSLTRSRRWIVGRIFGLDGRESYRELRLELLCCPHCLSRGTAPHEREYPRRKDRF
jgi:hypothetical protein